MKQKPDMVDSNLMLVGCVSHYNLI